MTQHKQLQQPAPDASSVSWGSWISSVANTAYSNVLGAPPTPDELTPTTALTKETERDKQSHGFGNVDAESRNALWRQLVSVIGMDVMHMRLSLPIWLFEPTTALSRMAETFEYSDLLDRAASCEDPILRDCLVAAFVISAFSHTERVRKPFNPVLGETFEFINPLNGMKFYAEQVSHHPPISVSRCDGNGWHAGEVVHINATFQGNSIEITNNGTRYIHFTTTGDHYTWNLPQALVSNLFVGTAFVDHFGSIELRNERTNTTSILELTKCGWFSAGRYEVTGELLDDVGNKLVSYHGAWNKSLDCERRSKSKGEGINRLWMAGSHLLSEEEGGGEYGEFSCCTKYTKKVLAFDSDYAMELPPTDSRLRPDRLALAKGDRPAAAEQKLRIEQMQRERRAQMNAGGSKGTYEARYFKKVSEEEQKWEPIGNYWSATRRVSEEARKTMMLW
eukprot:TRINITY_DN2328_c0_g1_i1.p1 TRINITY_DN2328_c0_g1~~TRINITY_DN2328_c0_g1_i1.p1  ORF type:complete len:449 (+),score=85.27 TRINITY_DN2328_c0_g1_i1:59-1405(+)